MSEGECENVCECEGGVGGVCKRACVTMCVCKEVCVSAGGVCVT